MQVLRWSTEATVWRADLNETMDLRDPLKLERYLQWAGGEVKSEKRQRSGLSRAGRCARCILPDRSASRGVARGYRSPRVHCGCVFSCVEGRGALCMRAHIYTCQLVGVLLLD
jgi:hypothetical protein